MKTNPIIKEVTINAPVAQVWKAITDKNEMKHWYFDLENFEPVVGFQFQFYGGTEDKQYLHLCTVKEVIVNQKLSYSWRYEGYPGNSLVTFELFDEGDHTRVKLTHEGVETFPTDDPNFAIESFTKGWNQIIGTNLKEYLEKEKAEKSV